MHSPHVAVPASATDNEMTQTTLSPSHQDGPHTNGIVNGAAKSGSGSGSFETTTAAAAAPLLNSSTTTSAAPPAPRALPEICFTLRRKLLGLLEEQTDDLVLRGVQDQVRISMGVIEKAICMYRSVSPMLLVSPIQFRFINRSAWDPNLTRRGVCSSFLVGPEVITT